VKDSSISIGQQASRALLWSGTEQVAVQLIRFLIGIVLARLLTPAEFGLVGMIMVFTGIAQVFVNCGFGEALIQKQDATHADESSVFYANIGLGVVSGLLLFLTAPLIANFYGQSDLVWYTRVFAVVIVINSFGVVQSTLLTKALDFRTQFKVNLAATVCAGIVAIFMSFHGCGVMSLVALYLVGDLVRVVLLWVLRPWRPDNAFSFASLRNLFPYSSRLFASGLLNSVFSEIYAVVIGKLFQPTVLGLFTRARQFPLLPADFLTAIAGKIAFPLFASIQEDKPALKDALRRALKGLAWLSFPLLLGLGVVAHSLVLLLLTEKWMACAPYIQLLCFSAALKPLSMAHLKALAAQGRGDLFLRLEIIKKPLIIVVVALTYRYGVEGMLWGDVANSLVSYYINAYYSNRLLAYLWKEQLRDLMPYIAVSVLMGTSVWLIGCLPLGGNFVCLAAQIAMGIAIYGACSWGFRFGAFTEAQGMVRRLLRR
jgi:teichuronic acid exporter